MRVCLDTNDLTAAFATRGLCADDLRAVLTEHELVGGEVIVAELRRNFKAKLKLPDERIGSAEAVFSSVEILPKPESASPLEIRDRDDRWILATAIVGRADVLVTGDQDLLAIAGKAPVPILTPRAFRELLRNRKLP